MLIGYGVCLATLAGATAADLEYSQDGLSYILNRTRGVDQW